MIRKMHLLFSSCLLQYYPLTLLALVKCYVPPRNLLSKTSEPLQYWWTAADSQTLSAICYERNKNIFKIQRMVSSLIPFLNLLISTSKDKKASNIMRNINRNVILKTDQKDAFANWFWFINPKFKLYEQCFTVKRKMMNGQVIGL